MVEEDECRRSLPVEDSRRTTRDTTMRTTSIMAPWKEALSEGSPIPKECVGEDKKINLFELADRVALRHNPFHLCE